jgi:hypothetical protein
MITARASGNTAFVLALTWCLIPAWQPVRAADDGDNSKVLGSVRIAAGQHAGDATTVNGSVEIGANAVVKHAGTVNGGVTMREHSAADSVETVNGSVRLDAGAKVSGSVELVNGHISLDKGADVSGHLTNVNGSIELSGAHVGGGIETTTGDIEIGADSHVDGGILIDKSDEGWFNFSGPRIPRVVIGPGAVVAGRLTFRREVKLYVSDRATIGTVEGATAIRFSGATP